MNRRLFVALALAALSLFATASPADAAPVARLLLRDATTGTGVVLTDTDGDGVLTFSGGLGGASVFTINVTTGIAQPPAPGGAGFASLSLTSINVAATGGGTLQIILQATPFDPPSQPLIMQSAVSVTSLVTTPPNTITLTSNTYANGATLVPITGADVAAGGAVGLPGVPAGSVAGFGGAGVSISTAGGFAESAVGFTSGASGYSLFTVNTVVFQGVGTAGFTVQQVVVPAPAGLMLAATGLPFLALAWRRRRNANAQVA
jgi:hypothetical protein